MSNPTSLSDTLPSTVPKLESSGLNWPVFSLRFQDAVEAKGFWGHFDGTSRKPVLTYLPAITVAAPPSPGAPAVAAAPLTPAAVAPNPTSVAAITAWEKNKRAAKSLLTQKIPDSALMRIQSKVTVKDRWNAIVTEYTEKGTYAQTDLRTHFLEMKCPDKGNIREFLETLTRLPA